MKLAKTLSIVVILCFIFPIYSLNKFRKVGSKSRFRKQIVAVRPSHTIASPLVEADEASPGHVLGRPVFQPTNTMFMPIMRPSVQRPMMQNINTAVQRSMISIPTAQHVATAPGEWTIPFPVIHHPTASPVMVPTHTNTFIGGQHVSSSLTMPGPRARPISSPFANHMNVNIAQSDNIRLNPYDNSLGDTSRILNRIYYIYLQYRSS